MADSYTLEVSHVLLQQPPDHLLTYDYCLSKTLKCINSLKSSHVEKIQPFELKLKRHILCIHKTDINPAKFLQDIFKGEVTVQQADVQCVKQDKEINGKKIKNQSENCCCSCFY